MVLGDFNDTATTEIYTLSLHDALPIYCTLKVLDCPAARVSGNVSPLMLKPAPVKLPCAMVKLAPPELVKVRFCTPVLPTSTLPKLTLSDKQTTERCTQAPLRSLVLLELKASLTS